MFKSFCLSTFILLCATVIESSILSNISFLYVVPDIVLICSIYFSLLNGKLYGETSGFISGLILDFVTGIPFGFNCIYRTIIGYAFGFFSETVVLSGILMPMVCVGIGTIAQTIFISLINFFYPNVNIYVSGLISYEFLFRFIFNVILAPFIFKLLNFFRRNLSIVNTKDKVDNVQ